MPHIIPETQTSSDTMQENESQLISVSQLNIDLEVGEFAEEYRSSWHEKPRTKTRQE